MKFVFNFDNFESANNEVTATTYYGGYFTVNGETFYATGNDRGESINYQIQAAVEKIIGRELTQKEEDELSDTDAVSLNETCEIDVDWPIAAPAEQCHYQLVANIAAGKKLDDRQLADIQYALQVQLERVVDEDGVFCNWTICLEPTVSEKKSFNWSNHVQQAIDKPIDEFKSLVKEAIANDSRHQHGGRQVEDAAHWRDVAYKQLKQALQECRNVGFLNPKGLVADALGDIKWS